MSSKKNFNRCLFTLLLLLGTDWDFSMDINDFSHRAQMDCVLGNMSYRMPGFTVSCIPCSRYACVLSLVSS
ncbi:hypothetical protein ACB098_07G012400 [Castanea mollissima]